MTGAGWVRSGALLAVGMLALACKPDDPQGIGLCTETMVAGQSAECVCQGRQRGVQTCQDDGTLTECTCAPAADDVDAGGAGDGDGMPGGDGDGDQGAAGRHGDGDGDPGPGDGDGTGGAGDGDGSTGDGDAATGTAPTDGEQQSFCETTRDCNRGLICYGTGRYCTGDCLQDADCPDRYTCVGAFDPMMPGFEPLPGFCRLDCDGPDDATCPEGMACVESVSRGGFSGGELVHRCAYTEDAIPPGAMDTSAFEPCDSDRDCLEGLACVGGLYLGDFPFPGGLNFCTQRCTGPEGCTEAPTSGTAPVECVRVDFGEPVGGTCELDCRHPDATCPDGMACINLSMGGGSGLAICDYIP